MENILNINVFLMKQSSIFFRKTLQQKPSKFTGDYTLFLQEQSYKNKSLVFGKKN